MADRILRISASRYSRSFRLHVLEKYIAVLFVVLLTLDAHQAFANIPDVVLPAQPSVVDLNLKSVHEIDHVVEALKDTRSGAPPDDCYGYMGLAGASDQYDVALLDEDAASVVTDQRCSPSSPPRPIEGLHEGRISSSS